MLQSGKNGGKNPIGRASLWAVCFAYLLFTLSPHFETVSHSHAGGDHPHHHNYLSAHDVALERYILTEVGDALVNAEALSETQTHRSEGSGPAATEQAVRRPAEPKGTAVIRESEASRHTHGQADPNLLSVASSGRGVQFGFACLTRIELSAARAADAEPVPGSARAPPARPA